MEYPLVSWLMPMYNSSNSARRAIDSMLAQTYTNFEIIIVLDPSDEETVSLCKEYEKIDARVHLIQNKERLGIAGSLNVGLKNCKGKYIARMDADDYSYPDRLEKQVRYMEQHPEIGLLGGNARNIIEKQSNIAYQEIPESEEIRAKLLFSNCIMHPTIMFRSEIGEKQYPYTIVEDYAFYVKLRSKIKMAVLPDVIIDYSVHQESSSSLYFNEARKENCRISRKAIFDEFGIDTVNYDDSLFGWRSYDNVYDRVEEFLCMHLQLIQEIIEKNTEQKKFASDVLLRVLNQEWQQSLWMVRPYNYLSELNQPIEQLTSDIVEQVFRKLDVQLSNIEEIIANTERIVIYGIGQFCESYLNKKERNFFNKIVCFCDSNPSKQGDMYFTKLIISPNQLDKVEFDIVVIASPKYEKEIKEALLSKGISQDRIILLSMWNVMEFHKNSKIKE